MRVVVCSSYCRARTCLATMGSKSCHQSSSLRVGPGLIFRCGSLKVRALAACAFACARFSVSLYEFRSQFKNLNTSRSYVLFLAAPRLLCSPLGKASTTVLVMDEDTGTSSRSAAKSQESCSLVLEDISVLTGMCVLWFYSGASLALARGKTERGGLGTC